MTSATYKYFRMELQKKSSSLKTTLSHFSLKQKWNITSGHRRSTKPHKHFTSPVILVTKGGKVRGTDRRIRNFKVEKTPSVHMNLLGNVLIFLSCSEIYRHTYMYELGLQGKVQHHFCLVRNKKKSSTSPLPNKGWVFLRGAWSFIDN